MEPDLFADVAGILPSLLPPGVGRAHQRAHRYGVKVWFGGEEPNRDHYEAQVVGARDVPGATVLALEVGFHAEQPKEAANEATLAALVAGRKAWAKVLGDEATAGPFLGRATKWRRLSETWIDPDLSVDDLAFEIAARLADYITALEPLRRAAVAGSDA